MPMKKRVAFPFVKKCYNIFYEVIYHYSAKNLENLLAFDTFGILFNNFVKEGNMDKMICEDPTFAHNPKRYRDKLLRLVNKSNAFASS
jgi:hypothetical protein